MSSTCRQSRSCEPSPNSSISSPARARRTNTGQEAEAVAPEVLAGPVHVGQPQRGCPQAVDLGVDEVELLARQLVDTVHVDRVRRVQFVDGQVLRPAVHLACRGLHDHRLGRHSADQLEEPQVARDVEFEVAHRVEHRLAVADLAGDVEDDVDTVEHVGDRRARRSSDTTHLHVARARSLRSPPCSGTSASTTTTSAPAPSRRCTTFEPMNPSPPVTRQRRPANLLSVSWSAGIVTEQSRACCDTERRTSRNP